ncbi:LysR family transcriptional regulator [Arthrobacter nitrophenolicus]|uniref:LysR family transcriptional regulator n=1 Tax=Arthrobacter nitrophenolicus TaxID=683150 RepID=A0A4V3B2A4_9MICC|nr:LysR family transcriptional regulator [Arthrobacter nitrophenolicus]TDL40088.1 LysR family transcriptional regulator [Arthrobacter nitrophenolicus]
MVEVRQARYFIAVAEELNFSRAADRLNMSQPPLSQAILQLERQLGITLLNRSSRSVMLTDAGHVFLEQCRLLVRASERAREVAALATGGLTGTLRIGAVTSVFNEVLPGILQKFRASRPLVELHVQEIDSHHGRDALERRELDVAIVRQSVAGKRLRTVPLRRDHFVVVMQEGHRLEGGEGPVSLTEFRDESWVWLPRQISPDYHDELVAACRQAGFSPEAQHYANSINSQLAMVRCGLGVTLAPKSSVTQQPQGLVGRELRKRVDLVELSVMVRAGGHEPLVEHFIACSTPEDGAAVQDA